MHKKETVFHEFSNLVKRLGETKGEKEITNIMGPKKAPKSPEELLETVVIIDEVITTKLYGQELLRQLEDDFEHGNSTEDFTGRVKCSIERLDIKNSICWLAKPKKDSKPDHWQMEKPMLVFINASEFVKMFKDQPDLNAEQFLTNVLNKIPDSNQEDRYQIYLIKDKSKSSSNEDKILEQEMKRIITKKALDLSAECLVMYKVDLHLEILDIPKILSLVTRSTKSILKLIAERSDSFQNENWYPKKSGNPVSVNTRNKVGLTNLWQRYLMQVSVGVNIERSKVITNDPGFSTIQRATSSYARCSNEKEAIGLLSAKTLRPSGATQNTLALGNSRPKVGEETSRKVYRVLTSLDPNERL